MHCVPLTATQSELNRNYFGGEEFFLAERYAAILSTMDVTRAVADTEIRTPVSRIMSRRPAVWIKPEENARELQGFFGGISAIFGLDLDPTDPLDAEVGGHVQRREELRKTRRFAEPDAIRDDLLGRGILLEDTPSGVRWKKKM